MTQDLSLPVEVIGMPTERADDGLALSSRNGYLDQKQRVLAPTLYQTLCATRDAILRGNPAPQALADAQAMLHAAGFRVDYLELRRQQDLHQATAQDNELVLLVAAFLGQTRLIDNLQFSR